MAESKVDKAKKALNTVRQKMDENATMKELLDASRAVPVEAGGPVGVKNVLATIQDKRTRVSQMTAEISRITGAAGAAPSWSDIAAALSGVTAGAKDSSPAGDTTVQGGEQRFAVQEEPDADDYQPKNTIDQRVRNLAMHGKLAEEVSEQDLLVRDIYLITTKDPIVG